MSYQAALTQALETHQAFFAFGDKQFKEKKEEGVIYVHLGAGLICPKANAKALAKDINNASKNSIKEDLKNNTPKEIIWRELANHEAQILGSIDDTVNALEGYNFTREQIQDVYKEYFEHCCEHDLF